MLAGQQLQQLMSQNPVMASVLLASMVSNNQMPPTSSSLPFLPGLPGAPPPPPTGAPHPDSPSAGGQGQLMHAMAQILGAGGAGAPSQLFPPNLMQNPVSIHNEHNEFVHKNLRVFSFAVTGFRTGFPAKAAYEPCAGKGRSPSGSSCCSRGLCPKAATDTKAKYTKGCPDLTRPP